MSDSFKLEDNYNKKKSNNKNKIVLIFVFCVIILCVLYFIFFYYQKNNFGVEKIDTSKNYIYTVKKVENAFQEDSYDLVPKINLKGEKYSSINEQIMDNYLTVSNNSDYDYSYEYSKSDNILSLKITYAYFKDNSIYPIRYFKTFNIDLKNGKILSDEEILKMYGISKEKLNVFLEAKFRSYYKDLIKYKYYTEDECDYDCFLKLRGISSDYLDGISFYIEKGSLNLFKYYYTFSEYEEEQYFTDTTYKFIVKK